MDDLLKINKDIYTFLETALSDEDLLKYLYYTDGSPLEHEPIEDTISLLNKNIFTDIKIVNVQDTVKTFLMFYPDNFRMNNDGYIMDGELIFDVICHEALLNLDNGDKRVFCIADRINKSYHMKHISGLGKCMLTRFHKVVYNNEYTGYRFIYTISHGNMGR